MSISGAKLDEVGAAIGRLLAGNLLFDNTPDMQRLSVALYRKLADGDPVARDALAAASGLAVDRGMNLLSELPRTAIEYDATGAIVGYLGLSIAPTRHRLQLESRTVYTWCALDALFLPQVLAAAAVIVSPCPATGQSVEVRLTAESLTKVLPDVAVVSMVEPDLDRCRDDLRGMFCRHVNFFANTAAFDTWRDGRSGFLRLSMADAHALARQRNAARYTDIELPP